MKAWAVEFFFCLVFISCTLERSFHVVSASLVSLLPFCMAFCPMWALGYLFQYLWPPPTHHHLVLHTTMRVLRNVFCASLPPDAASLSVLRLIRWRHWSWGLCNN